MVPDRSLEINVMLVTLEGRAHPSAQAGGVYSEKLKGEDVEPRITN